MDGGQHWTMMDERVVQGSTSFSVAFDPTTQGHIIGYHPGLGMMESFDTGNTWSAFSPGSPSGSITAAAFSTDNPTKLVIGTSSGVYVLQNGAWQLGPATGNALRIIFVTDPSTGHQIAYAAVGGIIYQLSASGNWNPFSSGLPIGGAEQVTDIAGGADSTHFALYATISTASGQLATSGGVYRYASNNPTWTRQVNGLNGGNGPIVRASPDEGCDTGTDPQYQLLGVAAAVPDTAYVTAINTTCGNDVYKGTFSSGSMTWSPVYDGFQDHPTTTNLTPGWIEMQPPWGQRLGLWRRRAWVCYCSWRRQYRCLREQRCRTCHHEWRSAMGGAIHKPDYWNTWHQFSSLANHRPGRDFKLELLCPSGFQ